MVMIFKPEMAQKQMACQKRIQVTFRAGNA
jgi:hypothetical protein